MKRIVSEEVALTNINGKTYAMTAITPMKPWKTYILRLGFFVGGTTIR